VSQFTPKHTTSNPTKSTEINNAPANPSRKHGRRERKLLQTAMAYAPAVAANWAVAPAYLDDALDQIAAQTSGTIIKTVKVTYDFGVSGGAISTIDLGVAVPNHCVITNVMQDILTAPTSSDNLGTIHLAFPTDGALSANVTADGSHSGTANQSTGVAVKTTAARELSATIATTALTAGKINWFITYVQSA